MSNFSLGFFIASMTAAFQRGDLDETSRQGMLAGPAEVERALAATARPTVLAAIVAAPAVEDRAELLPALARAASRGDRRVAIPAARAARTIARELERHELPDDLAPADLEAWRETFEALATSRDRFVEVRIAALDAAAALAHVVDPSARGFADALLKDPDPAVRAEAGAL